MPDVTMSTIDFAKSQYRDKWLHHYAIGDPSWDTFVREPGNPIHVGQSPYEWPVNGFLFQDPPTQRWYAFVGLYPRGYWPAGPCLVLRERENGGWEEVGLALQGDALTFDGDGTRPGAMPDVSIVYADNRYHMVYDWANPDNSRGGIAYAWSDRPEGPYHRASTPIHIDSSQTPLLNRYVRSYAATLIQRRNDWIILHDMSTSGNAGGTWALACMTSECPDGPYSAPTLLLYPQSDTFLPPFMEYYPAFVHDGYIYAPATSVALNRNFQCIFRAPIEEAHHAAAWEVYQYGSVWHAEISAPEAQGIWGQTFSAQVTKAGLMRAYFTSKTREDTGTVHIARREWNRPYRDGFVLSAPNSPAVAMLRHHYRTFHLRLAVRSTETWSLNWQCTSPVGPDTPGWNPAADPRMLSDGMQCQFTSSAWALRHLDSSSQPDLCGGAYTRPASGLDELELIQSESNVTLRMNDCALCSLPHEAFTGRLQLVAEQGTVLVVNRFEVEGVPIAAPEYWLAAEALAGAATGMDGREWQLIADEGFTYGKGYVSDTPGAKAKWNYHGAGFRLFAPRGPQYGQCEIYADDHNLGTVDLFASESQHSQSVFEAQLPDGYHAIAMRRIAGQMPCDCLEVVPNA